MIKENQTLLNRLNVLTDAVLVYLMLPLAFWLRFVSMDGTVTVPLENYLRIGVVVTLVQVFTYAALGVYQSSRIQRIRTEVTKLLQASLLDILLLLGWLFLDHGEHYSRWVLAIFFLLSTGAVICKHVLVRRALHTMRRHGKNLKHVLLIGGGDTAKRFLDKTQADQELGFHTLGYIAQRPGSGFSLPYLGGFEALEKVLERTQPDEVISAMEIEDFELTSNVIEGCEKAGVKLSIIPFYSNYMPGNPQFDDLDGLPMLNIRRIPLDNFANAFVKRAMDILGSLMLIILLSPVMLLCALGVRLSSPGPILFRQTRVGLNKKEFTLLKFRTMRVNAEENSGWSRKEDPRRTRLGSFMRKVSLDELPQLFCVLAGSMSLVGPRPEIPHFVYQFKEEIPLYMVRHQVRPGITGWAQIHGFRGDTPIKDRVEHDIWYIENWSIGLDLWILFATVFKGKFVNDETLTAKSEKEKQPVTSGR